MKKILLLTAALILLVGMSCRTIGIVLAPDNYDNDNTYDSGTSDMKRIPIDVIYPIEFSDDIELIAAVYEGDLVVNEFAVKIIGKGKNSTYIDGDVYLEDNSTELRNMTILGNLYISGNNNEIINVDIQGYVDDDGWNTKIK